jgi:hypothetical protein
MHTGGVRPRRVPVEHRLFGLDRRTLPFAAVAVAVWLLWTVVLPWVDRVVPWNDTIAAGERIRLTDDVTFAPAAGWGLESGLRTTDRTRSGQKATEAVQLTDDGVSFFVQRGTWTGSASALLRQITKITTTSTGGRGIQLSSRPVAFQTSSGHDGVLESFRSQRVDGLIAALVFGDQGLQVQVVGPPDQLDSHAEEIGAMLSSIRQDGDGQ